MHRPGVMAPPTLYDHPQPHGLMRPTEQGLPREISLRAFFWAVAIVLAAVELCIAAAP